MKRVVDEFNLINTMKKINKKKIYYKIMGIPLLCLMVTLLFIQISGLFLGFSISIIGGIIAILNLTGMRKRAELPKEIDELAKEIQDFCNCNGNDFYGIRNLQADDIELIEGNLKIAEDLTSRIPIDILKKGKFVLIKDSYKPTVVFQSEEVEEKLSYDDSNEFYFFENTVEDEAILIEALPEHQETVHQLMLKR